MFPLRLSALTVAFVAVLTSGRLETLRDIHRLSDGDLPADGRRHAHEHSGPGSSDSHCPSTPPENATYSLSTSLPEGCTFPRCSYFVGMRRNTENPQFLDFALQANTPGWVAVGFSESPSMFRANVLGCNRYLTDDSVQAIDTWNPHSPIRNNILNSNQDRICEYSAGYDNDRIYCSFSRLIEGDGTNMSLNLDEEYYLLYGTGNTPAVTPNQDGFTRHQNTPEISRQKVNPVIAGGEIRPNMFREQLIKAHGTLMVIAWPVLAGLGVFFAVWMRPALPNGKWFQIHRALMLTSVLVGVLAFILVFIAHKDSDPPGLIFLHEPTPTAHFAIGITVMVLQIINPIVALFRCKPDSKHRWIFNISHGKLIGYTAIILSSINIAIGISLYLGTSHAAFGVYMTSFAYAMLLYVALYMIKFITAMRKRNEEPGLSINALVKDEEDEESAPEQDHPSKGPWLSLLLFLMVMLPLLITVIILIAAA